MQVLVDKLRFFIASLLLSTVPGLSAASEVPAFRLPAPGAMLPRAAEPGTPARSGEQPSLHIVVVSGENGANILRNKIAVRPIVEVRDAEEHPITGALVTFAAPSGGPGVVFTGDLRTATAVTDQNGRASLSGIQPRNEGAFTYSVTAQYQNEVASAAIHQVNYVNQNDASAAQSDNAGQSRSGAQLRSDHRGLSSTALWVIIGGAGAAAAGLAFGLAKGGSDHTSSTSPVTTIGPGTGITVGAPH